MKDFAMKKTLSFSLMYLALGLAGQQSAQAGPLDILGVAGQYNVFLFGDLNLSYTDVEGRAAAQGNVTLDHFGIGTKVVSENGIPSLVAGNNVTLTSGSVGCTNLATPACSLAAQKQGTIIYGGGLTVLPTPADVTYGTATQSTSVPPNIDFGAAQSYINGLSAFWKSLAPSGTNTGTPGNINLKANDLTQTQNVFYMSATDFAPFSTFNFEVAPGSVTLVNVLGNVFDLHNIGFTFNLLKAEHDPKTDCGALADYCHNAGFPFSSILFNFPDATNIELDNIAFNGSLIAPFATINSMLDVITDPLNPRGTSHIDGNVIAKSLTGSTESHAIPFEGTISAVPEPATLLLLAAGLLGMVARRRLT